jgi:hypothetical protein
MIRMEKPGLIVAPLTPFTADLDVDTPALRREIDYVVREKGVLRIDFRDGAVSASIVALYGRCALFGLDIGRADHLGPQVDLDLDANGELLRRARDHVVA